MLRSRVHRYLHSFPTRRSSDLSESLGPAFAFMPGYETFWSYIPHFIHSPFYVYAYAFGDGLVNALYAVYREGDPGLDRKSTRLNSSHSQISYAVFCLKKQKTTT